MKLASGIINGQEELLWISEHGAVPVRQLAARCANADEKWTMARLLSHGQTAFELLNDWVNRTMKGDVPVDSIQRYSLLAPVTSPSKVICVGLNYRPHVKESNFEIPSYPVLFNKFPNAVVGDKATIRAPHDGSQLDYEAELVIVIGKKCARVSEESALDYVFGYCNGNDISARDLQFRTGQWLLGKAADGFAPMGPFLVTSDEIRDPESLEIIGKRNGEVVQHSTTREMIFSCRYLISYISHYITLEPGDVIFTGTPEGVILGHPEDSRRWLQPGEQVSVSVEGMGELHTIIG